MSCARLAVFGALLTAACAPRPTANTDHWIASHRYVCDDGTRLTINWGREEAEAVFGNRRWRLRRAVSGSGARYADTDKEVWEHQGAVRVTAGATARTCTIAGR